MCQCQPIKASCCDWTRGVSVLATLHCYTLLCFVVVLCCALLCSFVPHCFDERHIVLDGGPSESAVQFLREVVEDESSL